MSSRCTATLVAFLLVAGTVAAIPDHPTTTKECTTVLDAEVCTWVVTENGRPTEIGATIPMSLVLSVPPHAEMTWPPRELASVRLPEAARNALGIDHLGVNWEAHGHPPSTFMTPHFDFHFYSITNEAVGAIDCSDLSKPRGVPEGYTLPDIEIPDMGTLVGLCVPLMGMHALPEADMQATDAFDASMIVGFYHGEPIFFEPMIAQSMLLERKSFNLPMPTVGDLPEGVHYPREFQAQYDARTEQYRFVFSRFDT